eukprot:CAMPEP_0172670090 /NCGR_PEP_ID=MMETSP1074-20121228/10086_1 /TAXON_ID=2916 /ORGANISM="Ceratium fusus, Strain PA161109" /LENGTH=409 /DNA_ID=CAMNT_0013486955 /DNA_START=61 /DNA_END=1287 /DNA_ORIENTATION=+
MSSDAAPPDHYAALGLLKHATETEVRQAYKKAALRWHPDKNPQAREHAEIMFKRVAAAYTVLSDATRRAEYDRSLNAPPKHTTAKPTMAKPKHATEPAGIPRQMAATGPFWTTGSATNGGVSNNMDEAYSVFTQFFGGQDPFKDFDHLFETNGPAQFDRFFGTTMQPGSFSGFGDGAFTMSMTTRTATSSGSGRATATEVKAHASRPAATAVVPPAEQQQQWQQQPVPAALNSTSRGLKARCLGRHGVAWRQSPNLEDRAGGPPGPSFGDIVTVQEDHGTWLRATGGWLPVIAATGEPLFERLCVSQPVKVRCLSQQGVAYRGSMDLNDRLMGLQGPSFNEIVIVEERVSDWIRTPSGWLPLIINNVPVFEFLEPSMMEAQNGHGESRGSWWPAVPQWPRLPVVVPGLL